MQVLINSKLPITLLIGFVFLLTACQKNSDIEMLPKEAVTDVEQEVVDQVNSLGVNLDYSEEIDFLFPDGSTEKRTLIGGCYVVTDEELEELRNPSSLDSRQYHTTELVSAPRVIKVVGITSGSQSLTLKMRLALMQAVANYNDLSLDLTFDLSFTPFSHKSADIVVYKDPNISNPGGSAGFPANGDPYKWVRLFGGLEGLNIQVVEHVITHEIGHCLGLRHTDYFSRESCGQNTNENEGEGEHGAIHVPGTPTGMDWDSVMRACFTLNEDGEFGEFDEIALEYLY